MDCPNCYGNGEVEMGAYQLSTQSGYERFGLQPKEGDTHQLALNKHVTICPTCNGTGYLEQI